MKLGPRAFLGALLLASAPAVHAQACNTTLNPGANVTAAVEAATAGQTICLNPGTYTTTVQGGFPNNQTFAIGKSVTLRGLGAGPANTILQAGGSGDYAVYFVNYLGGANTASNSGLVNLTLQGSNGGAQVFNFIGNPAGRLSGITFRDVVITTIMPNGNGRGILLKNTDKINIDNVTITSGQAGIQTEDASDTLIANTRVLQTGQANAAGLAILGGTRNVIVGNTFGSVKANPAQDSNYSITGGNVVFYNTTQNRFDGNIVQGHRDDGLDFQALSLVGTLPPGQDTQASTDNYAGKNQVIATGYAAGRNSGSAIWSNCSSHGTWLYGNDAHGSPECGICVWLSRSNMLQANRMYDNGIAGLVVSGGTESLPFCSIGAYQVKPNNNYTQSNSAFFNRGDQLFFRNSDNNWVTRNYTSPRNGFGGPMRNDCDSAFCQSAYTIQTDASAPSSSGFRFFANTNHENIRGLQSDDSKSLNVEFALNRSIQPDGLSFNRFVLAGTTNWDNGALTGGNYWSFASPAGNPSQSTPYGTNGQSSAALGVYDSLTNTTGRVVDRYPYQHETFGRGPTVTVYEPRAGFNYAQGTRRTVRWNAPACTYVDISLDGSGVIAANVPNTGYNIVTIPPAASVGVHTITVTCKNSSGTALGSGNSPTFNVSSSNLVLLAPGRDDVLNANSEIIVSWKKTAAVAGNVVVELSTDGGANFPTCLGTCPGGYTGTFARVTLPNIPSNANAVIRVRNTATNVDYTDGVFALRGSSGFGFTNVQGGRQFQMGNMERLEWASPVNSRLVDLSATVNAVTRTIATGLPDRGHFDWVVPDLGVGTVTLSATFRTTAGAAIGAPSTNNVGVTRLAQTITFQPLGTLGVGSGTSVVATANSGLAVAVSTLTPGVCSLAGTTVTGVSAGTCTLAGNQAGNATYAAATQVTISFTVVAGTNTPRLANIATRMHVLAGSDIMIAGFVITGGASKTVIVLAKGPSLAQFGVPNTLQNPTLSLVRQSDQVTIATNDNWQQAANQAAIQSSGFAPSNSLESAILMTLAPGAYTALVSGAGGGTGVGIVEVYEIDQPTTPIINISTRGQVLTGSDVMIAGFVIQGSNPLQVIVLAKGPSLTQFGIPNALANPTLNLVRQADSVTIATNDNWVDASNMAAIQSSGFAPSNSFESAILMTLPPGAYTAIVQGAAGGTGVGIVEVYKVGP